MRELSNFLFILLYSNVKVLSAQHRLKNLNDTQRHFKVIFRPVSPILKHTVKISCSINFYAIKMRDNYAQKIPLKACLTYCLKCDLSCNVFGLTVHSRHAFNVIMKNANCVGRRVDRLPELF